MIYVYGITVRLERPPMQRGLGETPVEALAVGDLTAVYSRHEQFELRPNPECCWAHEQVLETLMHTDALLPVRFGTTFADLAALEDAVILHAPSLRERLSRVRGCVEVAVRIAEERGPQPAPSDGRSYVLDKLARHRGSEAILQGALGALKERAVASKLAGSAAGATTLKVSYLVRSADVESFSEELGRLQREKPELALSATGPWPPFSFAGDEAA